MDRLNCTGLARGLTATELEDSMSRTVIAGVAMVVLVCGSLGAQVYQLRTPPPPVTAQYAEWQFNSEPLIVNSLIYYPTRETRFFDGQIMVQVGVYRSVPVYADVTLEPHSVIYVPVGRNLVRGYERRREGELAGTQGSRVPAFPVDIPSSFEPRERPIPPTLDSGASSTLVREPMAAVRVEPGSTSSASTATIESRPSTSRTPMTPTHVESIPPPSGNGGVWLMFNGSRWSSRGPAVVFDPDRFSKIGEYRGFPVYRTKDGRADDIWVTVVKDGPVAPYSRR